MGIFDKAKDAATAGVDQFGDQVGAGVDKAKDFVDEKTGGKFSDQIDQGGEAAKDALDNLDGKDDDIA